MPLAMTVPSKRPRSAMPRNLGAVGKTRVEMFELHWGVGKMKRSTKSDFFFRCPFEDSTFRHIFWEPFMLWGACPLQFIIPVIPGTCSEVSSKLVKTSILGQKPKIARWALVNYSVMFNSQFFCDVLAHFWYFGNCRFRVVWDSHPCGWI